MKDSVICSNSFNKIRDMNHDSKIDAQDYLLWHDICEKSEQDNEQQRTIRLSETTSLIVKLLIGLQVVFWIAKFVS